MKSLVLIMTLGLLTSVCWADDSADQRMRMAICMAKARLKLAADQVKAKGDCGCPQGGVCNCADKARGCDCAGTCLCPDCPGKSHAYYWSNDDDEAALFDYDKQVGTYRHADKKYFPRMGPGKWGTACQPPISPPGKPVRVQQVVPTYYQYQPAPQMISYGGGGFSGGGGRACSGGG